MTINVNKLVSDFISSDGGTEYQNVRESAAEVAPRVIARVATRTRTRAVLLHRCYYDRCTCGRRGTESCFFVRCNKRAL